MKVTQLLEQKFILKEFKEEKKEDIINELINLFKDDPRVTNLNDVKTCVLEREKIMSTGVGKGFAIPHGKTNSINEIIAAFGKSEKPIYYDALDGEPVHLVFLLVGKDALVGKHIKLLSRISRMMNSDEFREKLINANDEKEILKIFHDEEQNFPDV
ncbi:MAG: PTS sugar transporter subunit IIA [Ignavibacteria bacterium]|nr:PTS sugar transporter subunit IIA [Ignavibacteria bacterium]MBT8382373.1 PTS sugar transporter subunit IIA [Ignavibacteria bacterium]MBT8391841.1 PTS sugar transporter subunit IIA [Ignavibacteria bacterium]NNJ51902.1 PTS sugar transporter subunit IIA [Ignavibacteriaceae bacterium]NNL21110.1 PTS sugar transporter subunit IIA [Ignavibacteriaceae bacterium]